MIWRALAALLLRLRAAWWQVVYRSYRARYDIDPGFVFNGAGIQCYGEGRLQLGASSYIGELSTLQAAAGHAIVIGRHCAISHNVRIYTTTSDPDGDRRTVADALCSASVRIGDGAWIGANCFIAPGVEIGENVVVGANSVVTRSIPGDEIWGGVPARFIRRKQAAGPVGAA